MALPPTGSPAMDRAERLIDALPFLSRESLLAEHRRRWDGGIRPQTDAWGRPIIADPDAYRRRIETAQRAARWETLAGQVEAARMQITETAA